MAIVVRIDHDPASAHGHNVTEGGVHIAVYRDGKLLRSEEVFPPMSPNEAFIFDEEHLAELAKRYTGRFARWHGLENP